MPAFDTILLPTDGSEAAQTAIDQALDLADTYGSTVHVLYVVEDHRPVARLDETIASGSVDIMARLEEAGEEAIEEVVDQVGGRDVSIETTIHHGNPSDEIIDYAAEHDIDLIVMATHGRTGVKRAVIGSVTENVVRHADVSVLIAK